jgi:hypothetical protein
VECELIKGKDNIKKISFPDGRKRTEAEEFCLNHCPYPKCADDVRSQRDLDRIIRKINFRERIEKRNGFMRAMSSKGILNPAIARHFGICCRHVRRIVNGR